jgi:hypothetical protein
LDLFLNKKAEAVKEAREAIASAGLELGGREASQQLALALLEQSGESAAMVALDDYFKKLSGNNQKSVADVRRVIDGAIAFKAETTQEAASYGHRLSNITSGSSGEPGSRHLTRKSTIRQKSSSES